MHSIVIYYSNKGSNKYLAKKIAAELECDTEAIRPRINVFFLFLMNINLGIRPIRSRLSDYDRVIMVGPIWMGRFIPPLKSFVKKYAKDISQLVFVTCCGSTYKNKDEKFGHGLVFKEARNIVGDKLTTCQAFPIGLVLPDALKEDSDAFMKTHLNESNFKGEILQRFEVFMKELGA